MSSAALRVKGRVRAPLFYIVVTPLLIAAAIAGVVRGGKHADGLVHRRGRHLGDEDVALAGWLPA